MKKVYAILNAVVIIATVGWNYYAGSIGFDGNTVGSLSDTYSNLFTPAGYAFSIWGLIFLLLLAHAYYQIKVVFITKKHDGFIDELGPWLILANIGNMAWLYFWLTEQLAASVMIMLVILFSLLMAVIKLNMQRWDAPFKMIRNVWWPITVYFGWISVATIANISAYLVSIGWEVGKDQEMWAMLMIGVAVVLKLFILFARSMREYAAVGVWAVLAIALRHWDRIPSIQWTAVTGVVILLIAMTMHARVHWNTNPLKKWMDSRGGA